MQRPNNQATGYVLHADAAGLGLRHCPTGVFPLIMCNPRQAFFNLLVEQ